MDRRILEDLESMLGLIDGGTASHPQRIRRVDLALKRMEEWQSEHMPTNGMKGGSSSPREVEDGVEERALAKQIQRDLPLLKRVLGVIGELPAARAAVMRYTSTIDATRLPKESSVPGCASCARTEGAGGRRIGGFFSPVIEENLAARLRGQAAGKSAVEARLCRWCWDFSVAHNGSLPPLNAIELLHRQSARAAGVWLAKQELSERKSA